MIKLTHISELKPGDWLVHPDTLEKPSYNISDFPIDKIFIFGEGGRHDIRTISSPSKWYLNDDSIRSGNTYKLDEHEIQKIKLEIL